MSIDGRMADEIAKLPGETSSIHLFKLDVTHVPMRARCRTARVLRGDRSEAESKVVVTVRPRIGVPSSCSAHAPVKCVIVVVFTYCRGSPSSSFSGLDGRRPTTSPSLPETAVIVEDDVGVPSWSLTVSGKLQVWTLK
ncbi:hypothetical protein EVAR_54933_1 [Eumeta japonica]|uniref:Uncharacterized protein n=1 Tax=Eumeta variegata TaxID=151549 RepID=A0A4C1YEV9_EUMVA|nr:hypothetical protein EVAR_54933_1 [Eumeta japonica]